MTALYRWCLRLLPAATRDRHGPQMADVFEALLREARVRHGWRGAVRVATRELWTLAHFAWRDRRGTPRPPSLDERDNEWAASPRAPAIVGGWLLDLRHATRMLTRTPGLTLVCVLTMALAIGANTAIFTVVKRVLLEPLPFPEPDRLFLVGHRGSAGLDATSPANVYAWQAGTAAFESLSACSSTALNLTARASAERVVGLVCTGSVFEVLGRTALVGRTFTAAEDTPTSEPVIVLSEGLWRRLYAGDASVVGQMLDVGGLGHRIVGVMPADFQFPDREEEFWAPARLDEAFRANRDQYYLLGVARLRRGATREQAEAQLAAVRARIHAERPLEAEDAVVAVAALKDVLVGDVRPRLWILMGSVVCVLLIACANLGNLLLARASGRRREMALRHTLGARPSRIVRHVLTEGLVLAGVGGLAGLGVGGVVLDSLVALLPNNLPRAAGVHLDGGVLAFTAGISVACGLAFGLLPALHLAGAGLADGAREGTRSSVPHDWFHDGLVALEVALALMLLSTAGLLTRSFVALSAVNPGFRPAQLLTFRVSVSTREFPGSADRLAFFDAARQAFGEIPGVSAVAMTTALPVTGRGTGAWFNVIGAGLPSTEIPPSVPYRIVAADTLQVLGIPLLRGRYLSTDDRPGGTKGVVVSASVGERFWPGRDPLGARIYLGAPANKLIDEAVVVGVVADVKQSGLDESSPLAVYVPHALLPWPPTFDFALRTSIDPVTVGSVVRDRVRRLHPTVPVYDLQTMDARLSNAVQPTRDTMVLLGALAAVALSLAILGVFGVLSYAVGRRTPELGVRIALGATAPQVLWLVVGRGMVPVLAGVGLGLGGALAAGRLLGTLVYGVAPSDPATLGGAALLLVAVALCASFLPARRAMRVDPVVVLRAT